MSRPRGRALRVSDTMLAALGYTVFWCAVIIVLSVLEEITQPGDPAAAIRPWVIAAFGFLPIFATALVTFLLPLFVLRRRTHGAWFFLAFVLASMLAFALFLLGLTRAPTELVALDWGWQQIRAFFLFPAVGGAIAGVIAWRRARHREALPGAVRAGGAHRA